MSKSGESGSFFWSIILNAQSFITKFEHPFKVELLVNVEISRKKSLWLRLFDIEKSSF